MARRWAFLLAFWALYAPFVTAAGYTWLFVDCNHCKVTWLKLVWGAPGFVLIVFVRQLAPGGGMELSLAWGVTLGAALSLALAALAGWLMRRNRVLRWLIPAGLLALSTWGAIAMFMFIRM